jgi:hypothetical protein
MFRIFVILFSLTMMNSSFSEDQNINSASEVYLKTLESSAQLLKQLDQNRDRYVGIEYISAAGTSEAMMSRFGHSLLRFVDNDNDYTNDVVLSFEANTPSSQIDYQKGIMGGYEVLPRFDLLQNFWVRYVRHQSRPLHRLVIPSNKEMRNKLIDELVRMQQDPSVLGDYTFLNRNCAGVLAQLFINTELSFKSKSISGRVPVLFQNWLNSSLLVPYAPIISLSPYNVFKKVKTSLSLEDEIKINDYEKWPDDSTSKLRNSLNQKELLFLYNELSDLPFEIGRGLLKGNRYSEELTFNKTIGMTSIPHSLYQLCETESCARHNLKIESKIWGRSNSLKQLNKRTRKFIRTTYKKRKVRGSVIPTYVRNSKSFTQNKLIKQIKLNFNLLLTKD